MGRFDKQLEYWRKRHWVAAEELQDLQSGKKKMAEDTGDGWTDTTDRWTDKLQDEVVAFKQLIVVYEKLSDWTPLRRSPSSSPPTD